VKASCTSQSIFASGQRRRTLTSAGTLRQTSPKALGRMIRMRCGSRMALSDE
jgi:hypothetical protein